MQKHPLSYYSQQQTTALQYVCYGLWGFVPACIGGFALGTVSNGLVWALLLGLLGMVLALTGVSLRTKYIEARADAVCSAIIGIAVFFILEFLLTIAGVRLSWFFHFNHQFFGWHVAIFVAAILFVVFNLLWLFGVYLKMTPEEKDLELHGDDWFKPEERTLRLDAGITLACSADEVWPYLKQSGQTQAGWYSYDWLERLCTFDIHNHYTIHPEWQDLKPGDYQWFHQAPWSIGEWITEVSDEEHYWAAHSDSRVDIDGPNQEKALRMPGYTHFAWTWNWLVYDIDEHHCRFIFRCDCGFAPFTTLRKWFIVFLLGTASIVMCHGYMACINRVMNGTQKITEKTK